MSFVSCSKEGQSVRLCWQEIAVQGVAADGSGTGKLFQTHSDGLKMLHE